jgi:2-polyprenyl-6-methoxyphenol hydroxylase-like FAD-dependent oxidoreductase
LIRHHYFPCYDRRFLHNPDRTPLPYGVQFGDTQRGRTMSPLRAVVVGGSLSGLCAALALAANGADVVLFERDRELGAGGAGLGVERSLLGQVTDSSPFGTANTAALPVITSNRDSTAWMLIYQWLRSLIDRRQRITLHHGIEVMDVRADASGATVVTAAGPFMADLVVGADGYRSTVRRNVAPDQPDATFAGYMLWRGLVAEADLPAQAPRPSRVPRVGVEWKGAYRLVAYYVPGADGSIEPGHRRISWAWYDPFQDELLRKTGAVDGGTVRHSIVPSAIPADLIETLQDRAREHWPEPWRSAVQFGLRSGRCFGTPIAEYVPKRLIAGHAALVGDAAHVSSPMTGSGLHYALLDVLSLRQAIAGVARGGMVALALERFERARLADDRQLALYGQRWSRDYLASL